MDGYAEGERDTARDILKIICRYGGSLLLRDLAHNYLKTSTVDAPFSVMVEIIRRVVMKYIGHIFTLETRGGDELVRAATQLGLCQAHGSKDGCSSRSCPGLHLCKFFINDVCRFDQDVCTFGHNLWGHHNCMLLRDHDLDGLQDRDILYLLRQNCPIRPTFPRVCKFYNSKDGCDKGDFCTAIHICKYHVQGSCSFGLGCKRNHDIFHPQSKGLLAKHHVDLQKNPNHVLSELRSSDQGSEKRSSDGTPGHQGKKQKGVPTSTISREDTTSGTQMADTSCSVGSTSNSAQNQTIESSGRVGHTPDQLMDTEEICTFWLRGRCNYGNNCRKHHTSMPYQWQYKLLGCGSWLEFNEDYNEEIEMAFCDPSKTKCDAAFADQVGRTSQMHIDFRNMTAAVMGNTQSRIRRLSTLSYIKAAPTHKFTTRWSWYWQDEAKIWRQYGDKGTDGSVGSLSSDQIELRFLEDKSGTVEFSTAEHHYILMFHNMAQKNMKTGKKRKSVRRPVYVSKTSVLGIKKRKSITDSPKDKEVFTHPAQETMIPPDWDTAFMNDGSEYQLVQIYRKGKTLDEYLNIESLFHKSMFRENHRIQKISRVQNAELWEKYSRNKTWRNKKAPKDQEEKLLFHGTRESHIPAICQQGFDWRMAGSTTGAMYGKGSYFAVRADLSQVYTDCRKLFVARVLVGEYTNGSSSYVRPPSKGQDYRFDTCVDNLANPKMFVVFEQERSYPEYLIEY